MKTLQASPVLDKLRSRGYWRVVIRPAAFQKDRIGNLDELFRIVRTRSVQLRGWDYPHVDLKTIPLRGSDWVGQEYDRDADKMEVWRFYQSGQFIHFFSIAGDWRDLSKHWPPENGWEPGKAIYYLHTLYSFVEIFEFGTRLALSDAGYPRMHVEIDMEGLAGRRLVQPGGEIALVKNYQTEASSWKHLWDGLQTDLIAKPRQLAAEAARDFFAQFGLQVSVDVVRLLQDGLRR